jgi:hypothetical protein
MQEKQFDNLMLGQDAKWADFKEVKSLQAPGKPITAVIRKEIERHEKPIPEAARENIDELITKLRNTGMKESKVKRIVKNTFKITVI